MATTNKIILGGGRIVKPYISHSPAEARRAVIKLYKAWFRSVPKIQDLHTLPYSKKVLYAKLREEFRKNEGLTDLRAIDMLVVKGKMELQENSQLWSQPCHIMRYFESTAPEKPNDFLGKFFSEK